MTLSTGSRIGRPPVMVLVVLLFGFVSVPYLAFSSRRSAVPAMA
ncbi:MAG: hypothetical protein ABI592_13675 [Acidobacteriota bacterium]